MNIEDVTRILKSDSEARGEADSIDVVCATAHLISKVCNNERAYLKTYLIFYYSDVIVLSVKSRQ